MTVRVDFTPMVDMNMLLITFFMLCTTLSKPQTMEISMPSNDKDITDAGGVIKTSDKVRLGAAMADLASVVLGFVPGANLASTGIGVGSSLAEFGADWASDGLEFRRRW